MSKTAAERCAEMVLKAMRSRSKTASEGFLAAAQLFALAAEQARRAAL